MYQDAAPSPSSNSRLSRWTRNRNTVVSISEEELKGSLANLYLHQFAVHVSHGQWVAAPHLRYLSKILTEAFLSHTPPRICVSIPPRHGKSELMSRRLPEWLLYWMPESRIILTSYEAEYAAEWGRKVRDDITEESDFFGFSVRGDSSAANRWETTKHGIMVTAGAGGAITGRGGNLLIIDDPIKNAEEASSPTVRKKIWDWFISTAFTRLEPHGAVILMMTRWNEDDLYGHLKEQTEQNTELTEQGAWTFINIPAICESEDDLLHRPLGTALWPERYPVDVLNSIKGTIGSYFWSALYRGSPIPQEGTMFKREWFTIVDDYPHGYSRSVRYWDLAATAKKTADFTAGCRMIESNGQYWILDMQHVQASPLNVEKLVHVTAQLDGYATDVWMEEEGGATGKNSTDHYRRYVLNGYSFFTERPGTDKVSRARGFSAAAEAGNVHLLKGPWNEAYLNELCSFPYGAHDDQVDSSTGAYRQLTDSGVISATLSYGR